uniref:Uncharacterized protein n=1 Tax=Acrobeloides nanus TaxID=290746 RepID=A0A914D7U7_9BILA
MPSTLIEAACTERRPRYELTGRKMLECQPLQYKIRVLKFDKECDSFKEQEETISLACVPVLQVLFIFF